MKTKFVLICQRIVVRLNLNVIVSFRWKVLVLRVAIALWSKSAPLELETVFLLHFLLGKPKILHSTLNSSLSSQILTSCILEALIVHKGHKYFLGILLIDKDICLYKLDAPVMEGDLHPEIATEVLQQLLPLNIGVQRVG